MTREGTVHGGTIILDNSTPLPDGTRVTVSIEPVRQPPTVRAEAGFFHLATLNELAAAQGVGVPPSFDALLGGWPEGKGEADFEASVASWRRDEVRRGDF